MVKVFALSVFLFHMVFEKESNFEHIKRHERK